MPGPDASIRPADLKARRIVARRYRNRRIGEFFKELELTEGRGTGIPKIRTAMERNGSPKPKFETDDLRLWFRVDLPIHPAFAEEPAPQVTPQVTSVLKAALTPCSREELQGASGMKDREHFRKQYLLPLLEAGLLEMTIPDKPRSSRQQYRTTALGRAALGKRAKP